MQWFEKIEVDFEICSCPEGSKVMFVAYTFAARALTWQNDHIKSLTLTVANFLGWENLKAMMMEEYCTQSEVQKLEQELWNLTMTGSDIEAYTTRLSDLVVLYPGMASLKPHHF